MTASDCWAEWLATRRFGGDAELRRQFVAEVEQWRDQILDRAGLNGAQTLLDVGCGEGVIGFGALERGVPEVIFSDISEPLIELCREAADSFDVTHRCRFVRALADDLSAIASESVDVVTTRSVLIYVADKQAAFDEFFRVLRPGGRISLFEPINRFAYPEPEGRFAGFDVTPVEPVVAKVRALYRKLQPADSDPMLDFDERDLVAAAERAGFLPVNLHLEVEIRPHEPRPWKTFVSIAGNPKIPNLAEAMDQVLEAEERRRLTEHLRPLVEAGHGVWRMAHAYLWATKPVG